MKSRIRPLATGLMALFAVPLDAQTIASSASSNSIDQSKDQVIELTPFEVSSKAGEGYFPSYTGSAGRLIQNYRDIPQHIDIIGRSMLDDVAAASLRGGFDYVPGLKAQTLGGFGLNNSYIRGFAAGIPLRNGLAIGSFVPSAGDIDVVERIEVLKGAASILYGESRPGGIVNYVTKDPQYKQAAFVEGRVFSNGGYSVMLDTTGPVTLPVLMDKAGNPKLAYRVVLKKKESELFTGANDDANLLFGKVRYSVFDGLTLKLEAEQVTMAYPTNAYGVYFVNASDLGYPFKTVSRKTIGEFFRDDYIGAADEDLIFKNTTFHGELTWNFLKNHPRWGNWNLRLAANRNEVRSDTVQTNITNAVGGTALKFVTASMVGSKVIDRAMVTAGDVGRPFVETNMQTANGSYRQTERIEMDIAGDFTTGPIRHETLIGTNKDRGLYLDPGITGNYIAQGVANFPGFPNLSSATALSIQSFYLDKRPTHAPIGISPWDFYDPISNPNGKLFKSVVGLSDTRDNGWSPDNLFVIDNMHLLKDRLIVSAGWRTDDLKAGIQTLQANGTVTTALTPYKHQTTRFGVTYKFTDDLSVYALRSESFTSNPTVLYDMNPDRTAPWDPQVGLHYEAGVRANLFHRRLTVDLSVFQIQLTNVVTIVAGRGITIPGKVDWYSLDGIRNRGAELVLGLDLGVGTQAIFTWEHNSGEITADLNKANIGKPLGKVPEDGMTLWSKKTFTSGPLRNFSLGGGYRYTGKMVGVDPASRGDAYMLPGFFSIDLLAAYQRGPWKAQLNVTNLTDEWGLNGGNSAVQIFPISPRQYTFSIWHTF